MITAKSKPITIIGAGIAGCFMSILLAKKGYKTHIYERYAKEDITTNASKRSFNLTFFGFGVKAFKQAGLWETLLPNLIVLKGSMTQVSKNSKPIYAPLDHEKMPYYCVSRANLIHVLLDEIEKNPLISISYENKISAIDKLERTMTILDVKTQKSKIIPTDVIFGADGVNSQVRQILQRGQETKHLQEYANWGYKQLLFTKADVENLGLLPNVCYTWSRKKGAILEFPNLDHTAVAMFVLPKDPTGFGALTSDEAIKDMFTKNYPDLLPALPSITSSILENLEGTYVTIHTQPWYYKDYIAIIGDAAHGFYPFFGQGMSAAFGDCLELVNLIDAYNENWDQIFPLYEKARKIHMDALGDLSKMAFSRYQRDKKADFTSIYEKLEEIVYSLFPQHVFPPLFMPITNDPDHTYDHVQKYTRQRRLFSFIGIPLAVAAVTGLVYVAETASKAFKKENTAG